MLGLIDTEEDEQIQVPFDAQSADLYFAFFEKKNLIKFDIYGKEKHLEGRL